MGAEGGQNHSQSRASRLRKPDETYSELVKDYREKFGDPYVAARHGWLDDVIEPSKPEGPW